GERRSECHGRQGSVSAGSHRLSPSSVSHVQAALTQCLDRLGIERTVRGAAIDALVVMSRSGHLGRIYDADEPQQCCDEHDKDSISRCLLLIHRAIPRVLLVVLLPVDLYGASSRSDHPIVDADHALAPGPVTQILTLRHFGRKLFPDFPPFPVVRLVSANSAGAAEAAPSVRLERSGARAWIGLAPTPCPGAEAARHHALAVDVRDDVAVAGKQRLGRAHLRTQRQLALGQPVAAVLLELGIRQVRLRAARTEGALVHLAAGAEVADLRKLRRAERASVEAVAAADA